MFLDVRLEMLLLHVERKFEIEIDQLVVDVLEFKYLVEFHSPDTRHKISFVKIYFWSVLRKVKFGIKFE